MQKKTSVTLGFLSMSAFFRVLGIIKTHVFRKTLIQIKTIIPLNQALAQTAISRCNCFRIVLSTYSYQLFYDPDEPLISCRAVSGSLFSYTCQVVYLRFTFID
jgi:hypothetical protein